MAYDPGPEALCGECGRLVPLDPVTLRSPRPELSQHRTYRYTEPFRGGPGQCPGGAQPPARVTDARRIDGPAPLP